MPSKGYALANSLVKDERVGLVDFGTFQVMERKARKGVNSQTRRELIKES